MEEEEKEEKEEEKEEEIIEKKKDEETRTNKNDKDAFALKEKGDPGMWFHKITPLPRPGVFFLFIYLFFAHLT
jgi:hypothetical protein